MADIDEFRAETRYARAGHVDLQDVRDRAAAAEVVELFVALRGTRGFGWTGEAFTEQELEGTRTFLGERATSIYSGSNEIQRNIIAKRVLGLPD